MLIGYVSDSMLNNDIRAALLSLMVVCYVDERPRFVQSVPLLIYPVKEGILSTKSRDISMAREEVSQQ